MDLMIRNYYCLLQSHIIVLFQFLDSPTDKLPTIADKLPTLPTILQTTLNFSDICLKLLTKFVERTVALSIINDLVSTWRWALCVGPSEAHSNRKSLGKVPVRRSSVKSAVHFG